MYVNVFQLFSIWQIFHDMCYHFQLHAYKSTLSKIC